MEHAKSLLPKGKEWKLVWHDEFDGNTLDLTKWSYRLHLLHRRWKTYSDQGAVLDGKGNLLITLYEKDGDYYAPYLQTGENFMDRPSSTFCFNPEADLSWPIGKIQKPKFMHKFGFYEIRCKLQSQPGWWTAFWLQSPCIGATLDPRESGVEVDIMEAFAPDGTVHHTNHWNGYGADWRHVTSGPKTLKETADGFHVFGLEWTPDEYIYYIDGEETWRCHDAVSQREQFILIDGEAYGYRVNNRPDERVTASVLPDYFVIDYVRVYDEVK